MLNEDSPYALVADDDALIRMDATTILEDAGFRSHEAACVDDALAILEAEGASIQILFSDVQMPPGKRDGFELARLCAERWPHISIIVASGRANPKDGDMPDGACFIRKPFSTDVVYDQIQKILPDDQKPEPLRSRAG